MRLAARVRAWVYPAILVMLPLVIAGGASGPALASGPPAAKYIGADAYSSPTWTSADTPGTTNYLGHLQSQKFFYNNENMNTLTDATPTSNGGAPGCGATKPDGSYEYPKTALCVIAWDTANNTDGSDLHTFLESTLTDPHQIIMSFCNEPEFNSNSNFQTPTCVCDTTSMSQQPCNDYSAFINQFEVESNYISKFESNHNATNVTVAEVSGGTFYGNNTKCNYIVPSTYVDSYLIDIYEGRGTNLITQPATTLETDPDWKNWVNCTSAPGMGLPRGIAEFAINCMDPGKHDHAVGQSYLDDASYLEVNFSNLKVWNLWDSGSCAISADSTSGINYAPEAVADWQKIVAGTN